MGLHDHLCYQLLRFEKIGVDRIGILLCHTHRGSVGDDIEVSYRLSGRKWQRDENSEVKFFLNAEATQFKVMSKSGQPNAPSMENEPGPESYDEDEAPF